jgi:hypothetical protein
VRAQRMFQVNLAAMLTIAAVAWPAAAQAKTDLRSPDARDAGRAAQVRVVQDLRSPDARDAAAGPSVAGAVLAAHTAPSVSDGFEWGDAGIGAGGMLILLTLASGTVLLALRTRRRTA